MSSGFKLRDLLASNGAGFPENLWVPEIVQSLPGCGFDQPGLVEGP